MSRFLSDKTTRLELSGGDWIDVKASISFDKFSELFTDMDQTNPMKNVKIAMPLLKSVLVAWSFKDDNGVDVPCDEEHIQQLATATILEVLPELMPLYVTEKKS